MNMVGMVYSNKDKQVFCQKRTSIMSTPNMLLHEGELKCIFDVMLLCHSRPVNFDEFSNCKFKKKRNADFQKF